MPSRGGDCLWSFPSSQRRLGRDGVSPSTQNSGGRDATRPYQEMSQPATGETSQMQSSAWGVHCGAHRSFDLRNKAMHDQLNPKAQGYDGRRYIHTERASLYPG
jgi:hypothetical protein